MYVLMAFLSIVCDLCCTILPMGTTDWMTTDWYNVFVFMAKT